jgi:tRNA modification GTPase
VLESVDTIAAVATPPGKGGVGIVRVSGTGVRTIAQKILGKIPSPRQAFFCTFCDTSGEPIDEGIALFFAGPRSFTGEDILELQGHGGPVVMEMLLETVLAHGARIAKPGEFSLRAFLQGKIDLTQAEAIASLIDASTQLAAQKACRSLQGAFSAEINVLSERMQQLRRYVEASIDFPEEEIDFLSEGDVAGKIADLLTGLEQLLQKTTQGQLLQEGLHVAIVGEPNAGKSSLLNALTREETAIVTDIPGTTRDLIKETIQLDGIPIHLIDTAGIREKAGCIEKEGIKRAKKSCELADRILLVKGGGRLLFRPLKLR